MTTSLKLNKKEVEQMAEEQADNEEKGKSSVVKIIMIVVGILLLVLLSVVGTLFATGFLIKPKRRAWRSK